MRGLPLAAALLGIALGFVSARYLPQGNPLVTVPWGLTAVVLGTACRTRPRALLVGGALGFAASYSYLWFDDTSPLSAATATRLALVIIVPAVFGLLCGALAAWLGAVLGRALRARAAARSRAR